MESALGWRGEAGYVARVKTVGGEPEWRRLSVASSCEERVGGGVTSFRGGARNKVGCEFFDYVANGRRTVRLALGAVLADLKSPAALDPVFAGVRGCISELESDFAVAAAADRHRGISFQYLFLQALPVVSYTVVRKSVEVLHGVQPSGLSSGVLTRSAARAATVRRAEQIARNRRDGR